MNDGRGEVAFDKSRTLNTLTCRINICYFLEIKDPCKINKTLRPSSSVRQREIILVETSLVKKRNFKTITFEKL